ncbi:hypothetical protein SIAM614_13218 [Stappia aggregata IAM 12614]|uniref:Uncharacterized protein n=1 Tax=Roseibium aggregatum (strain ATCC 25650 / DSM 13394 / JCM 20685 / NBRC 16684 / NCIMB 2208 / IAM 12614 / B1) TaxID=384765 RepID=A0NQB9_ROSAI|nr:hypothetical protein [Roseibium aggregatum]EAV44977.1 hypothetical protein SIAM614_13218 [Stappia aggregata IAM 12614] [Roseibium aggregatum IAM 12614]
MHLFSGSLLFILTVLFPFLAEAQTFQQVSGQAEQVRDRNDGTLVFNWDAKIALGTLLGEPMVSVQFLYKTLPESVGFLPFFLSRSSASQSIKLSDLPEEALIGPRLYEVKMQFDFQVGGNSNRVISVRADVGAPGKGDGQTWSYNTPGSPAWSALFSDGGGPLSAAEAKEAMKAGLKLVSARILSAEISWLDLQKWYVGPSRQDEKQRLLEAEKLLAAGMERSYGYKVKTTDPKSVTPQSIDKLAKRVEKMAALPPETRISDNHGSYQAAVQMVQEYKSLFQMRKSSFKFSDLDVAKMPQGHPAKFDSGERAQSNNKVVYLQKYDKNGFGQWGSFGRPFLVKGGDIPSQSDYDRFKDRVLAGPFEEWPWTAYSPYGSYLVAPHFRYISRESFCSYDIIPMDSPGDRWRIDTKVWVRGKPSYASSGCKPTILNGALTLPTETWDLNTMADCDFGKSNSAFCREAAMLTCTKYDEYLQPLSTYKQSRDIRSYQCK